MAKTLISIRLETDLLDWYKAHAGDVGYQARISSVLKNFQQQVLLREQRILGRAQQIFFSHYARCFWHLRRDLEITLATMPMIQHGLRKYGGLEGARLAAELDLRKIWEFSDAAD